MRRNLALRLGRTAVRPRPSFQVVALLFSAVILAPRLLVRSFCGARAAWRQAPFCSARGRVNLCASVVVTDDAVPEGHKGLHSTLYGEGAEAAEAAHRGADVADVASRWPGRLDGSELLVVEDWLEAVAEAATPGEPPSLAIGLYALYADDAESAQPWHVGFSRRVPGDLTRHHVADAADTPVARYARVKLLGAVQRMWTRARLEEACQAWALELAPGADAAHLCADKTTRRGASADLADDALTPKERLALEERKFKLRLAMGVNLGDEVEGEDASAAERRLAFLRSVEGDDWSAVIDGQTRETEVTTPQRAASPFSMRPKLGQAAGEGISKELTVENVRALLESLRPVLRADGGDLEVLGVDSARGVVMLGLMGACVTCPAAPMTMENGIEKALFDHFGRDVVREVVRVDSGAADATEEGIRGKVTAHLSTLQEALAREGASATLAGGDREGIGSTIEVSFVGPAMLHELVRSSLAHRFPELAERLEVRLVAAA